MQSLLGMQKDEKGFLMVGLDAAGKTTILHTLRLGKIVETIPTIGFNVETLEFKRSTSLVSFTVWDVGGRLKLRPMWRHYYQQTNALIFVVDCSDRDRVEDAQEQLQRMLEEEELAGKPLLVFANKQDIPGAISVLDLTNQLLLHNIRGRRWFIQASCATTGDGLFEGLDWLDRNVRGEDIKQSSKSVVAMQRLKNTQRQAEQLPGMQGVLDKPSLLALGSAAAVGAKGQIDLASTAETESTADTESPDDNARRAEIFPA